MFITQTDFAPFIKESRLTQLLDQEPNALESAIAMSIQIVSDALYSRYDLKAIFAKQAGDRDMQLVRWVITLALYFLYERLPDKIVPERVVKNYDDTISLLTDIEDGKKSTALPLLTITDTTTPFTKFRWGSNAQRSH